MKAVALSRRLQLGLLSAGDRNFGLRGQEGVEPAAQELEPLAGLLCVLPPCGTVKDVAPLGITSCCPEKVSHFSQGPRQGLQWLLQVKRTC